MIRNGRFTVMVIAVLGFCYVTSAEVVFTNPIDENYLTEDGTVALEWESGLGSAAVFEVRRWEISDEGEGLLVYEGSDSASFVSGMPEGEYLFRVRGRSEGNAYPEWSDGALSVTVEYIDGSLVAILMTAGAITFCCIVATILLGHRRALREESQGAR